MFLLDLTSLIDLNVLLFYPCPRRVLPFQYSLQIRCTLHIVPIFALSCGMESFSKLIWVGWFMCIWWGCVLRIGKVTLPPTHLSGRKNFNDGTYSRQIICYVLEWNTCDKSKKNYLSALHNRHFESVCSHPLVYQRLKSHFYPLQIPRSSSKLTAIIKVKWPYFWWFSDRTHFLADTFSCSLATLFTSVTTDGYWK